jgi:hypothetical protein
VVWVDAESGERHALNVDAAARVAYERGLAERLEAWRLSCARHRAVYGCWPSTTPFEDVVTELLS